MKNIIKKAVVMMLCCMMVISIFACSPSTENQQMDSSTKSPDGSTDLTGDQTNPERDTLTIAITFDTGTLDYNNMAGFNNPMRMVQEPLWNLDANGDIVYVLASELDQIEPTKWHIKLREGVTFENGNPLTAEDVFFSIRRVNDRQPPLIPNLNMERSRALDEYTIELIFDEYNFSDIASLTMLVIFDEESFDEVAAATTPNGTGPYTVTDYLPGSHLNMTLRDNYWGEMPSIKNLNFRIMVEDSQRINEIRTGMLDIAPVPYQDGQFVGTLDGYDVIVSDSAMVRTVAFNPSENSVFYDNPDARKAVALAIDRQAIIDVAYSGYATKSRLPAPASLFDVEDRFLDLGIYANGYDPVLAKEYAERSGLVGKEIRLINEGAADVKVVSELIQDNLRAIGVEVNVINMDPGSWIPFTMDLTQYDMAVDFFNAASNMVAQGLFNFFNYFYGGPYMRYPWPGSEQGRALAIGITSITDPQERREATFELLKLHVEAMPMCALVDLQELVAVKSDLVGYERLLLGVIDYRKLSWA